MPRGSDAYVCANCGRIGPIDSFNDDCAPGWTHGRLIKITTPVIAVDALLSYETASALGRAAIRDAIEALSLGEERS